MVITNLSTWNKMMINLTQYSQVIIDFLHDLLQKTGQKGYVLGLSGGIDSALLALLLKKGNLPFKALIIPIEDYHGDTEVAQQLAESLQLDYEIINLETTYFKFKDVLALSDASSRELLGNVKARLRMTTLYAIAQKLGYLVVGTDNHDEYILGYFTKYGDGGVDCLPIRHLLKGEVYAMAKVLGAPDYILAKVPSAGLFKGQTDATELGFSYEVADKYFLGEPLDSETATRIKGWIQRTQHKRDPLPEPPKPLRDKELRDE